MKRLFYIVIGLLLAACYEDKGNYDYQEVNAFTISLKDLYPVHLTDTVFTLDPDLSQSLLKDEDNLEFMWLHSTLNESMWGHKEYDTVSMERTLRFRWDTEADDFKYEHYFRLIVHDKTTGLSYRRNTKIKFVKPYDGAWMVLHSKDGQTELGAIEYVGGEMLVQEDAYYAETGEKLAGKPLALMRYLTYYPEYGSGIYQNTFTVFTDDPDEAGIYCQWKRFQKMDSLRNMVYNQITDFGFQNITLADGSGRSGALLISGKNLYQTPAGGHIYKPTSELIGMTRITLATKAGTGSLLYDEAGHRFAFYEPNKPSSSWGKPAFNSSHNKKKIKAVIEHDENVKDVDPNNLPVDQKVLWVGSGYLLGGIDGYYEDVYAYGLAKNEEQCFIYEFYPYGIIYGMDPNFTGYYSINIPSGLDENSCFASSALYNGIIFYSSGNTIYRLDFKKKGGQALAIYSHPGGKAVKMKFARQCKKDDKSTYDEYEFDTFYSLGIAFEMEDGTGEFVVLNLAPTGNIGSDSEHYSAKQVHTGFGKITDFVFI